MPTYVIRFIQYVELF